jgi:hypothetical protein
MVSVVVIGRSPDRAAGTSGLTITTNGLRRIDIVDEEFRGDRPQSSPALERCAALHRAVAEVNDALAEPALVEERELGARRSSSPAWLGEPLADVRLVAHQGRAQVIDRQKPC